MSSPAVSTSTSMRRLPLGLAGTTTGIGSLPFNSSKSAIQSIAEPSPEVPFWPQLPRLSGKEGIIGQSLGLVADLIEPRRSGYGYQVKEGRIDAVIDAFHQSNGHLPPENASGFGAFEEAMRSQIFPSALAVKGQIQGPINAGSVSVPQDPTVSVRRRTVCCHRLSYFSDRVLAFNLARITGKLIKKLAGVE